ncbi:DNA polymerase III, gamma/tau subunit [Bifidobacterium minimum]|uniref:DNA-directed DNA polymerase n=1 Tax=Bifidobacterium minimum TaxID=1693 RepID=A0A087BRB1_9BIFI|nr:DNA polymerase III subunit gamma/tau [Bifidobacterium minimum]KFI73561.1 DNA polymerase III, gamma/tau subunit [Bifidobacterium minimum]
MALALYRRYRPDVFADVIGQDQVTVPLSRALDEGRLTHAYLFSGPRGCGKTSSARILARCANCEKGPTSHPCGECDSCRDLATGGPGSIDVVEVDAASHNGVDDARELRERAGFAPARDRYKIFILDEAHMVTQQGFNALLKIVEEPPEHVMFIFATTEPDKVIGTIRSRTHHYPFRLVPPEIMAPYLKKVCAAEGTTYDSGVLRMVMRAGGGSVRDTLSVLDQLMVGAKDGHIDRDSAVALMGFTPDSLIGAAVDAMIGRDGPALYEVVEKVVASGFDPRRFVDDLLSRVRDLLVLRLGGDRAEESLGDDLGPDDLNDLRRQSTELGLEQLTSMAEVIDSMLSTMAGAVSPRMRLELLAARLLDLREGTQRRSDSERNRTTTASPAMPEAQAGFVGSTHADQRPGTGQADPSAAAAATVGDGGRSDVRVSLPTGSTVEESSVVRPSVASDSSPASARAPQSDAVRDVDRMWDSVVSSVSAEVRTYVDRHHIPRVSVSTREDGVDAVVMTFDSALSQHAFALAVDSHGMKASRVVLESVRQVFGPHTTIAPANMAADGEHVEKISRISSQRLAEIKRRIALAQASLAAGTLSMATVHGAAGGASGSDGGARETHDSKSAAGAPDDDDPSHRGGSPGRLSDAPEVGKIPHAVDDIDDESWYQPIPVQGISVPDVSSPVASPSDDDDVWASRTTAEGASVASHPVASHSVASHPLDGGGEAGVNGGMEPAKDPPVVSDGGSPASSVAYARPASPHPPATADPVARTGGAVDDARPVIDAGAEDAKGGPGSDDSPDEYSLADRSLESQMMDADEVAQMFQASTVERYRPDDPRNPLTAVGDDDHEEVGS